MEAPRQNLPNYTVRDHEHWEGKWELWHGRAVSMSPSPGVPHGRFASRVIQRFANQLDAQGGCGGCDVVNEIDWVLADDVVLKPDVAVVCDDLEATRIHRPPRLIVEVLSPGTHLRDHDEKRDLYREHGVAYYLLADPKGWTLHDAFAQRQPGVHRLDLHDGCTVELPRDWPRRPGQPGPA